MINTGRRWSFIQKMVIRLAMSLGAWLNVKMNTMWLLFLSHWKIRKKAKHKPKPDSTCWYVLGYITNYLKMRWLKTVFIVTSCGFWDSGSQRQLHWLIRAQFPRSALKRHDQTYADVSQHHGKPSCLASGNQGRASDGHIALSAPAQEYRSVHPQVPVCVLDHCPFLPGCKASKEASLVGNIISAAPESLLWIAA